LDVGKDFERVEARFSEARRGTSKLVALKLQLGKIMKKTYFDAEKRRSISGRISLLLLWLIGVPVPILVIIFLFRGCSS
jgi:hypothetical protein